MRLGKLLPVIAIATLTITGSSEAARPSPQQVLSNVQKAYSSLRSLEMTGTMTNTVSVDGKKKTANAKYSLAFQKPAKLRLDGTQGSNRKLIVSDGKTVYALMPGGKYYQRAPLKGGTRALASLGGPGMNTVAILAGVDFAKTVARPKIVAEARVSGADSYVVLFPLDKSGAVIQKLWVGKRDWLVRKNELVASKTVKEKSGTRTVKIVETSTTIAKTIRTNAPILSAKFRFTPPKGTKLFDVKKAASEQRKNIEHLGDSLEGKSAPAIALKDIHGRSVKLSSMKGKVVVVNFWMSGHPTCRTELAKLQKLYASQRSRGLEVIAIGADAKPANIKSFAAKEKLTFKVATGDAKTLKPLGTSYRILVLPTTYIINRRGTVVEHFVGATSDSAMKSALKKAGL